MSLRLCDEEWRGQREWTSRQPEAASRAHGVKREIAPSFFCGTPDGRGMDAREAAERLRDAVDEFEPSGKVAYVYNPLRYAWGPHEQYLDRFGRGKRRAILVGMNPGPWGMAQTGVPFGDVAIVRDWMGILGDVGQPPRVHPKRPVLGFANQRREPSGSRVYEWAQQRYGTAEAFFREFFILNYCPLLFYAEDGRNLTPPDLRKADTEALYAACDAHAATVARAMEPEFLIGIGQFAEKRLRTIVDREGLGAKVGTILHPSPASPLANRGWAEQAERQLRALGVIG